MYGQEKRKSPRKMCIRDRLVTARAFDLLGLPREQIVAVTMPCFGTTDRTYQNACTMTQKLGATLKEVDIRTSVTQHFADIGQDLSNHDVTYENGQARERTQVLMDIANQTGGLVVGTGEDVYKRQVLGPLLKNL